MQLQSNKSAVESFGRMFFFFILDEPVYLF
jgi:hypothetical protein